jgi:hypothetical protein
VAVADRVLEAAERADLVEVVADTLITRGSALAYVGRVYEGIGAVETAQRLAATHSFPHTEHRALNNLSALLTDIDPRAGLEAARAGLAAARRLGVRSFHLFENARDQAIRLGEWDWIFTELSALLEEGADPLDRTTALGGLITILAYRGAPTADLIATLEAIPMSGDDTVKPTTIAEVTSAVAFAAGRYDLARVRSHEYGGLLSQARAEAHLRGAHCALLAGDAAGVRDDLAIVDAIGRRGRAIEANGTTIRAGLAALEGRPRDALDLYRAAVGTWRDLGTVWDEALCAIEMVSLLGPEEPEVLAAAQRAREILVRLGAQPFSERLDQAMATPDIPADGKRSTVVDRTTVG